MAWAVPYSLLAAGGRFYGAVPSQAAFRSIRLVKPTHYLHYVDNRLEAWAAWKKHQNMLPGIVSCSILGRMIDEDIAALSHGQGWKPEPDYPEEEEVDEGGRRMPAHL